jgi:hypothetical protein
MQSFIILKQVVYIVSTGLKRVKRASSFTGCEHMGCQKNELNEVWRRILCLSMWNVMPCSVVYRRHSFLLPPSDGSSEMLVPVYKTTRRHISGCSVTLITSQYALKKTKIPQMFITPDTDKTTSSGN